MGERGVFDLRGFNTIGQRRIEGDIGRGEFDETLGEIAITGGQRGTDFTFGHFLTEACVKCPVGDSGGVVGDGRLVCRDAAGTAKVAVNANAAGAEALTAVLCCLDNSHCRLRSSGRAISVRHVGNEGYVRGSLAASAISQPRKWALIQLFMSSITSSLPLSLSGSW